MANKGKKKQKKPLCSIYHQERIQQTQQCQKARDLKYQVQESLEQCFVDWEELPEAEQQEILEQEIKLAEEALERVEHEQYLASLPTMDPDQPDQSQASSSGLPATGMTLSNNDIRNILISLSSNMHELTDHVLALTTQVTNLTTATPAAVAATRCHEPRYWSATDQYRATLLQGKRVQDTSLWFPYKVRAGRTAGNSRGHSLVQSPECGNEFNQAWESCTTTG